MKPFCLQLILLQLLHKYTPHVSGNECSRYNTYTVEFTAGKDCAERIKDQVVAIFSETLKQIKGRNHVIIQPVISTWDNNDLRNTVEASAPSTTQGEPTPTLPTNKDVTTEAMSTAPTTSTDAELPTTFPMTTEPVATQAMSTVPTTSTDAELPTTLAMTTQPITTQARTIPAIHYGPVSNHCRNGTRGECFWVELRGNNDKINYTQAVQICIGNGSVPAVIANRTELEKIAQYVVPKLGKNTRTLWLGLTVDFETKTIQPEGAYSSWTSQDDIENREKTNVYAMITTGTLKTIFDNPSKGHTGVVCWKP